MLGRDLSRDAAVPANYLSKIMLTLRDAGFVQATRGAGGGYRLARNPGSIHLVEVVALFDSDATQLACVLGTGPCSDRASCAAHNRWKEVRQTYVQFLEGTTLADLTASSASA